MLRAKKVDITGGPIIKSMLLFSLPIILGALVQVAFNAADLIVVGKMGGTESSAAVGAVSPVVSLLVNSSIGLSVGINAVLSRILGQNDIKRAARVVNTAVISSVVLGIILMVVCFVFSKPLLQSLNCDKEYIDGAILYMNIYAVGIPATLLYNFSAAIIRSMGDTTHPFIYLVIAGITNVVLNVLLCLVLENKVAAVAIATTVSQFVSGILTFVHLARLDNGAGFNVKKMSFSFGELWAILKVGAPSAFNSALFALSNLQMHSAINAYGTAATAGSSAASSVEGVNGAFSTGLNSATVPFVGQNIGANNPKRVKQSIVCAIVLTASISFIISTTMYILGEHVLSLYLPADQSGADAVASGLSRMKYVCRFYVIAATYSVFVSSMQAFGYSFVPMLNSIITVLVFRIFWLEVIYPRLDAVNHVIDNVYVCFTISWTLSLIAHFTMFMIIYTRYRKGKIKQI